MLFSTNTNSTAKIFGLAESVRKIAMAGFPAVDISFFKKEEYAFVFDKKSLEDMAKSINDIVKETGIVIDQAHAPFVADMTLLDEEMPYIFDFCGMIGVKNIVVHPCHTERYYGNEKKTFDRNIEYYKTLLPYAKKNGIKIALENMWQRHPIAKNICDDIYADPYELVRAYDTLNDPDAFTICLDLGHVALCGREPEDVIRIIGKERLGALHVHDVDYRSDIHTMPGVIGIIKWEEVWRALGEIDYRGTLTLEADYFADKFGAEMHDTVLKFMADITRNYAARVDSYRNK